MLLAMVAHARPEFAVLATQVPYVKAESRACDVAPYVEGAELAQRPDFTGLCSEAVYQDEDGQTVSLLLHVDKGLLFWLERLKLDRTKILLSEPPLSKIERFIAS